MIKKIWNCCGDIRITFWLLTLICLSLAAGALYARAYPEIFKPLNHSPFQDWMRERGLANLSRIWWLLTLLIALSLFGLNTFACTYDRFVVLWRKRKQMRKAQFFLKLSPSLIHICFLVMLFGHFVSLFWGISRIFPVKPGENIALRRSNLEILNQDCQYYESPDPLKGELKQCFLTVRFSNGNETSLKRIGFLQPCFLEGLSLHLLLNKKATKYPENPELKLIVRQEPGMKFIIAGFTFLLLLLIWYFPQLKKIEKEE